MGKPVVMGRKTYLSIGKPLPGRTNIVVSRDRGLCGAPACWSPPTSTRRWRRRAAMRCGAASDEIVVIGGTDIFAQTHGRLPTAWRSPMCMRGRTATRTFRRSIATHWREVARSEHPAGPQDDAAFSLRHLCAGLNPANESAKGAVHRSATLAASRGVRCKRRTAPL